MIEPPKYQKDAIPTLKGWKHPKRREILVSKKFTQKEIDEYLNAQKKPKAKPKPKVEKPKVEKPKVEVKEKPKAEPKPKIAADVLIELEGVKILAGDGKIISKKALVKRAKDRVVKQPKPKPLPPDVKVQKPKEVKKNREELLQKQIEKAKEKPKVNVEDRSEFIKKQREKVEEDIKNYDYTHILIKGSMGRGVLRLSEKLGANPTEYFSQELEWKLRDYQAMKGLVEDGIFGPKTQAKLYGNE